MALFSQVGVAYAEPARFILNLSGKEKAIFIFEKNIEKNKKIVRASIQQIGNPRYVKLGESYSDNVRWEANCAKRTMQTLNSAHYDLNGKPTSWSNVPGELIPLIPGTYVAEFFDTLCSPKFHNI